MQRDLFSGRYKILSSSGLGAQGIALQVRDTWRNNALAMLKIGISGQEHRDGTVAEFEALRSLNSPWIAPLTELGFASVEDLRTLETLHPSFKNQAWSPRPYLVRDWIDGKELLSWVSTHRPPQPKLLGVLAEISAAVSALHHQDLIHGDLKPSHILIQSTEKTTSPQLIDFGLSGSALHGHTGGTPGYLAPERLRGERSSRASDKFALGVVMVQTLLGQRLAVRATDENHALPPALYALNLPKRVVQALSRLLSANPELRPPLAEVHEALLPPSSTVGNRQLYATPQLPFLGKARKDLIRTATETKARAPLSLLAGETGTGKSRLLRQIGWSLQARGEAVCALEGKISPRTLFLQMARWLSNLSGRPWSPLTEPRSPDSGRRIQALADSLLCVLPDTPCAILWDDLDHSLDASLEHVLALSLLLDKAGPKLQIWGTTRRGAEGKIRGLFASSGFQTLELPPLTREDLRPLLQREDLARRFRISDLDRLYHETSGHPARLSRLILRQKEDENHDLSEKDALLLALASLIPGGITVAEAASVLSCDAQSAHDFCQRLLQQRMLFASPPGPDTPGQTSLSAPPQDLRAWTRPQLDRLSLALSAFLPRHPALLPLQNSLQGDHEWLSKETHHTHAPLLLLGLLERSLETQKDPKILAKYVEMALDKGHGARGIALVQKLLQTHPKGPWHEELRLALASLSFSCEGKFDPEQLSNLASLPLVQQARAAHLLGNLELRHGKYTEARDRAREAGQSIQDQAGESAEGLRSELFALEAAASAFLGDENHEAWHRVDESLEEMRASSRVKIRYYGLRGMALYMQGHIPEAIQSYQKALALVEKEGPRSELPLYLLNLGTAYDKQGRLALARQHYAEGARSCLPNTRPSTRALLLANRANIDIKLGRASEARELLVVARRIASEGGLGYVERFVAQLEADADHAERKPLQAAKAYLKIAKEFEALQDQNRACEMHLKAGFAFLHAQNSEEARQNLRRYASISDESQKLYIKSKILRSALHMMDSKEPLLVLGEYVQALDAAGKEGEDLVVLEEIRWTPGVLQDHKDPLVQDEIQRIATQSWRRVALTLPPDLRQSLAAYIGISSLLSPATPAPPRIPLPHTVPGQSRLLRGRPSFSPTSQDSTTEQFFRMLSLNRRIIGESDLNRLIPSALDIALELSGAERGFLLLREGKDSKNFRVAFSRDLDGRPIDKDHLEISATIAQKAAESGEVILTQDASSDQRFDQALSVHALRSTSILCVPIRDREQTLGCLYLDHRNHPEAFEETPRRMVEAFADQVALALQSAARIQELRKEKEELAQAKEHIQTLLQEKEDLLQDLKAQCKALKEDLQRQTERDGFRYDYSNLIAGAPSMRRVLGQVDRLIDADIPVVIQGESGTGKEVIAKTIHFNGTRRNKPFVAINCGAMSEHLLESELFGHKRGAFTGANQDRKGLFEAASSGTLFLDEVGEMSLSMQVKLLRALQEGKIRPVGATHEIPVEVRVVAATNRNLADMVQDGTFREDLFYRLATLVLPLPPLRERREDIPLLTEHFLSEHSQKEHGETPQLGGQALRFLLEYSWPGNVRQLENVLRAAMVLSQEEITRDVLRSLLPGHQEASTTSIAPARQEEHRPMGRPKKRSIQEVLKALEEHSGDKKSAAESLGISLRTLQRRLASR